MVEVYFTIEASKQAHKTQKVGRGSKTKFNVMIMAESTINTNSIDDGAPGWTRRCIDGVGPVLSDWIRVG